jgi:D-aspartate ligase
MKLPKRFVSTTADSLPPAVVVGIDVTGLTVARALARNGVPVLGIDKRRRGYVGFSGAFHWVPCDSFYDRGLIELLDELAEILPRKAALFLTMDEHVKLVAQHGQHLKQSYFFDIPDPAGVEVLMNKQRFAEFASANGWPIPQTHSCEAEADVKAAADKLTFPVIMKPRMKTFAARMHSPKKTFLCATAEHLLADYRVIAQWEQEVVVQEWIPGGDGEIYFSFHYFNSQGEEVTAFEGKKIRQYIPDCGVTASAVGVEAPRVTTLSREILTRAKCSGFCSVEYKRDPRTDKFYIMEPTVGRVDLQLGVALANGVDIVSHAYFHLVGRPYPRSEKPTHHVKWIRAKADFKSARFYVRRGDLSWGDYLRSVSGAKRFAVWAPSDYRMMLGFLAVTAAKGMKLPFRAVRKLLRAVRPVPQRVG